MGVRLTWWSDAILVLLRPCSLKELRASLHLPAPQAVRAAWARSRPQPELLGIRAVVQCFFVFC